MNELLPILDGSQSRPPPFTDETKMREWDKKQAQLKTLIVTAIKGKQLKPLVNCKNATEMWTKLFSLHEQKKRQYPSFNF